MNQHLVGSILGMSSIKEEKMIKKSTNQKKELPVTAMSVDGSCRNGQSV
jgi:hypothetical protein